MQHLHRLPQYAKTVAMIVVQSELGGYRAPSTAARLWNKAQGWTAGTTLGSLDGGAFNPNGVGADGQRRRLVIQPPGHNPIGAEGTGGSITQRWHRANPRALRRNPVGVGEASF